MNKDGKYPQINIFNVIYTYVIYVLSTRIIDPKIQKNKIYFSSFSALNNIVKKFFILFKCYSINYTFVKPLNLHLPKVIAFIKAVHIFKNS